MGYKTFKKNEEIYFSYTPPKRIKKNINNKKLKESPFGIKFLDDKEKKNKSFMLLCGFEKFDNFFIRIDILERLFMKIINLSNDKSRVIKVTPEMLNLLGCSKDDFKKLLKKMSYKVTEKENGVFFRYVPTKNNKKLFNKKTKKENPFGVLKNLNFN